MNGKQRAIFLDRDGVINENRADHVKSWDEFTFLPGALEAIANLSRLGLPIFIITNQAAVNRGLLSPVTLADIHARMLDEIERYGGEITQVYHCPHDNHENCTCRKPQPGMLLQAAAEHNLDLARSFLIGDACTDIQAGQAVNATCYLLMTGRGPATLERARQLCGDVEFRVEPNLSAAVAHIQRLLPVNPTSPIERPRPIYTGGVSYLQMVAV